MMHTVFVNNASLTEMIKTLPTSKENILLEFELEKAGIFITVRNMYCCGSHIVCSVDICKFIRRERCFAE